MCYQVVQPSLLVTEYYLIYHTVLLIDFLLILFHHALNLVQQALFDGWFGLIECSLRCSALTILHVMKRATLTGVRGAPLLALASSQLGWQAHACH